MASLEERLQRVEDQLAIYQLVCGYGYAMDGCNADAIGEIYAEDGVYDVIGKGTYKGRAGVQAITSMPTHLDLVNDGAAHLSTVPYVVIDGDRAVATCHTALVHHTDEGFTLRRVNASRIELERVPDEGWRILHRTNVLLDGDERARAISGS